MVFIWPLLVAGLRLLIPTALSTIGGAVIQRVAQKVQSGPVLPDLVEEEEDFLAEDEEEEEDEEDEEAEEFGTVTRVLPGGGVVATTVPDVVAATVFGGRGQREFR